MKRLIVCVAGAAMALAIAAGAMAAEAKQQERVAQPAAVQQLKSEASAFGTSFSVEAVKAKAGAAWDALLALLFGAGGVGLATTLAVNKPRAYELGNRNQIPVIAADIIYEGAAVGIVDGTGHARPLNAADRFGGFAEAKADNAAGAAAAINVDVIKSGEIELSVTGAVITDVGQPVYATDDDTFTFNPVGGVFIGFVKRFVSAGVAVVEFNAGVLRDPYGDRTVRELLSGIKTFDAEDSGKCFFVDSDGDGDALTLPAIAAGLDGIKIVAIGAFGTTQVKIDPAATDMILGPDITGADNKDLLLTKATQRRGDYVVLGGNDADGYAVTEIRGVWAREA